MLGEGGGKTNKHDSTLVDEENFDKVIQESELELAKIARQRPSRTVKDKILELDDVSLRSAAIDNDSTFKKLKNFLRKFTIRADE